MKSNETKMETVTKPGDVERRTSGISKDEGTGHQSILGGNRKSEPRRNWVVPWLTMSNSASCPYHCDWFDLNTV
jgi:hypothetical protein